MGWTFVRLTRDQLIRELTATEETERSRSEVIDHTLAVSYTHLTLPTKA